MVYINFKEGKYFFNPNHGLTYLGKSDAEERLFEEVAKSCSRWGLNYPRFYRMKLKEEIQK